MTLHIDPSAVLRVLLVEDHLAYANILKKRLTLSVQPGFEIAHADTMRTALSLLGDSRVFDVILTDLFLPDSQGLETFSRLHAKAPGLPIVVLTGLEDESLGLEAVRSGAQDYLTKGRVNGKMLGRILVYAVERHRMQMALQNLSVTDELTGLHNRRGFFTLAEQQLKMASRTREGFLLVYVDVDGLKQVNDRFGHAEGDEALCATARILNAAFRKSDIIARLGGDEFAVLAINAHEESAELLVRRVREMLEGANAEPGQRYKLSLSLGVAAYHPERPCTLEELMARADQAMYAFKSQARP